MSIPEGNRRLCEIGAGGGTRTRVRLASTGLEDQRLTSRLHPHFIHHIYYIYVFSICQEQIDQEDQPPMEYLLLLLYILTYYFFLRDQLIFFAFTTLFARFIIFGRTIASPYHR